MAIYVNVKYIDLQQNFDKIVTRITKALHLHKCSIVLLQTYSGGCVLFMIFICLYESLICKKFALDHTMSIQCLPHYPLRRTHIGMTSFGTV